MELVNYTYPRQLYVKSLTNREKKSKYLVIHNNTKLHKQHNIKQKTTAIATPPTPINLANTVVEQ